MTAPAPAPAPVPVTVSTGDLRPGDLFTITRARVVRVDDRELCRNVTLRYPDGHILVVGCGWDDQHLITRGVPMTDIEIVAALDAQDGTNA
jgi:hypothetical protein